MVSTDPGKQDVLAPGQDADMKVVWAQFFFKGELTHGWLPVNVFVNVMYIQRWLFACSYAGSMWPWVVWNSAPSPVPCPAL